MEAYNKQTVGKKTLSSENLFYNPTLGSVLMVEETLQKYSQQFGKYQLWKKLPKKMMYQTYLTILDYLVVSNKIMIDEEGCVFWTWNPERISEAKKRGLIIR
jgi:hypothetical protein